MSVPTLVVTGGALDGTSYELPPEGECVIGSNMDAHVQILLGNVESFHARITVSPAGLSIADAGSATGTFVNGEKVEGEHPLQEGDRICLGPPGAKGSAKMLVFVPSPSDSAAATAADLSVDLGMSAEAGLGESEIDVVDVSPADEADDLFSAPLSPPAEPEPPAVPAPPVSIPPPYAAPPPPPPPPPRARVEAAAPPPPPAPPAQGREERLTAPAPTDEPPPRPAAREPEYQTDLPSIPVAAGAETTSAEPQPAPSDRPFPSLRPSRRATPAGKSRSGPRRRRSLALPSLPLVPLVGALAVIAALGGAVWFFFLRATPPRVSAVAPARAEVGQPVKLTGAAFASDPAGNTVLFGAMRGAVTTASRTEIEAIVPSNVAGPVPIVVETKDGRSAPVMLTVAAGANATAIVPEVALPGQAVLIRGEGFVGQQVTVEMGGLPAGSVQATAEGVRAVVPALGLPEGSRTPVVVTVPGRPARSFELIVGRLPLVLKATPPSGAAGERVALEGRGFAPAASGNAVTFGGQPALVLTAAADALTVVAPAVPVTDVAPDVPIVVTANGRSSSGHVTFRAARGGSGTFVPRFYAAPVPEYPQDGLVFVSTALGPVLVLGGADAAPSVADRAVALADRLNALVERAASTPLAIEARETPRPAVAVSGEATPLLAATPEDVEAYARPWDNPRGAGRRISASALARHWAALLQDYIGLFALRQRPLRLLALSPRGKVLNDLYGEAARRSPGGSGIPANLVLPTPASLAADLRAMALVVSTEGGRAAVALEGRWLGTIRDPDLGDRSFSVQLQTERGRLAGTITTGQGAVTLTAPLRDVGFDRGSVRFTADLQGTAYRFKGTLDGNAVSGTIDRPGRPPARFTLQFAE